MAGLLPDTAQYGAGGAGSSRTWKIDWENRRIGGWTDGTEALRQAALLALLTPRFRHVIYSFRYGSELESLIGRDAEYAAAAAPSMAEEALVADGRFSRVTAGSFSAAGDRIAGTVTVTAGSGSFRVDAAV